MEREGLDAETVAGATAALVVVPMAVEGMAEVATEVEVGGWGCLQGPWVGRKVAAERASAEVVLVGAEGSVMVEAAGGMEVEQQATVAAVMVEVMDLVVLGRVVAEVRAPVR